MEKRAVILAAGRGSRMGASTENSHKCLSILNNKTLIDWQTKALKASGIENIAVVKGYKQEMILGDFSTYFNENWAKTNMIASLFCAQKVNCDTIVSYSDIVYKTSHVEKLIKSDGDIVILSDLLWEELWSLRFENPLDDAETFKSINNLLLEIGSKAKNIEEIQAQFIGLIKLTPKGWDIIHHKYESYDTKRKSSVDFTSILSDLLKDGVTINVEFINGGWCEVDNAHDLSLYQRLIIENKKWSHKWI